MELAHLFSQKIGYLCGRMKKKMIAGLVWLMFLFCASATAQELPLAPAPKREYRAVWVATIGGLDWPRHRASTPSQAEKQKAELCQLLDSLQALNLNTVLLQVRIRGDVIYPSSLEPFNYVISGKQGVSPGYDPLAFAVEECHKRALQLHAWMVTFPLGDSKGSVGRRYPELCVQYRGSWYLNPGQPATTDYLVSLATEIVKNYDIDGIHFDYIRYPDDPSSFPDKALYKKYSTGESLQEWRRGNITRFVRTLYKRVKELKPWVCVSCSPLGKFKDTPRYSSRGWNAYNTVYQDAQGWLKEGIMDALFPMLYFDGDDFYPFAFDWHEQSGGRYVAPGLAAYKLLAGEGNWETGDLTRQLYAIRHAGLEGAAYFRANQLYVNLKGINNFLRRYYVYPSLVPALPWCDSIAPAQPARLEVTRDGNSYRLNWQPVEPREGMPALHYNVYADSSYPVDVTKACNLVATTLSLPTFTYRTTGTPLHFAVTAIDRFGNESAPALWKGTIPAAYAPTLLDMPRVDDAKAVIVICDIARRPILKARYAPRLNLSKIGHGCYFVDILSHKGVLISSFPIIR